MKRVSFLKQNSTLKRGNGFKKVVGNSFKKPSTHDFKHSIQTIDNKNHIIGLKRSSFKRKELTPQQRLDSIVSQVVRLKESDDNGMVKCATCKTVRFWKAMQCGHYQRRGNISTRYFVINLAPQCPECNCERNGEPKKFAEYIDLKHGLGTASYLRKKAREITKNFPYEEEIIKWQEILSKIVDIKGNRILY